AHRPPGRPGGPQQPGCVAGVARQQPGPRQPLQRQRDRVAFAGPVGGLPLLVTGFVVSFFGTGPIGALGTHLVVSSAAPGQGGSAASLQETSGHLGVAAGIAALGSLGAAVYREKVVIPAGTSFDAARDNLEGALALAGRLPEEVLAAARAAYTSGLNTVAVVCAVFAAAAALVAITALRRVGAGGVALERERPLEPSGTVRRGSAG
ncbi:hypothetical protein AB0J22_48495, partial [Nonomuraea dietziae]